MFRGDYYIALTDFLDTVDARGEKIDGVEVDNPYEYYTGKGSADDEIDWAARLADLENVVKSRGLKFNIIINSEGGNTSPLLFYFYTMEYIKMYLGNGGAPDTITVESWYTYPDKTLPESERNTLFRTACDVYDFTENFYYEKTRRMMVMSNNIKIKEYKNGVEIKNTDISLEKTFTCGQCFR